MRPLTLRRPTPGRAFAWLFGASAAAALAACEITAPLANGAQPLEPLANYSAWWSMMESCSGQSRPMRSVSWYMVPGRSFISPTGQEVAGLHQEGRITIAGELTRNGRTVRHEMLHAIVGRGPGGVVHPAEYFITKCGGFVDCNKSCLETSDAPASPTGVAVADPKALEVSIEADTVVSLSGFGGLAYTSFKVSARNPLKHDVVVKIPGSSYGGTFAMSLAPPHAGKSWQTNAISYGAHDAYFRAGQTKTYLFDLYLSDVGATTGDWVVGGAFGTQWVTQPVRFRVTP